MGNVKTAISIKAPLLKEADALACKMAIPRSRLFSLALEEFIEQHKNRQILQQLNEVYSQTADVEEEIYLQKMKNKCSQVAEV